MNFFFDLLRSFTPAHDAFIFMWLLAGIGMAAAYIASERWISINRWTDYDASAFFKAIKNCILEHDTAAALALCSRGGERIFPKIAGSALRSLADEPALVPAAVNEERMHSVNILERRLNFLVMFGNVSTLFGLLGTVYGLIMSFTAVSKPSIAAVEKSSLLAAGISTAMNSTLVGLTISVACVMVYSILRTKVDAVVKELDRYTVPLLNVLNIPHEKTDESGTGRPVRESGNHEEADADVTPMLNLMVILIPVLLTSSEFVKVGAIDLNLPEATASSKSGDDSVPFQSREAKLDLGIAVRADGFSIYHYFKTDRTDSSSMGFRETPDIPLVNGTYDYDKLHTMLMDVKKQTLAQALKSARVNTSSAPDLPGLCVLYESHNLKNGTFFPDVEDVKIIAEDKIEYQTVVSVMDAARSGRVNGTVVPLFPNVAIAGGIIQ